METLITPSCNESTLAPYVPSGPDPWNTSKINHVFRRLGFGAHQDRIDTALALTPDEFIDQLVDDAFNLPSTPTPFWGNYTINDFTDFETENQAYAEAWRLQTGHDLISEDLRSRLTFFWMNHFVTEYEVYGYAPYMFQYYNTIQIHALGNLKDFVHAIGINSTMLIYLNGFQNTNIEPNENYARELYELFTMGEGSGYTQEDIVNTSRALTGYNHWNVIGDQIFFDPSTFDNGDKTIFGQTGNWGYDDVIDILFQEKPEEVSLFICEKLYQFFVSPAVDETIKTNIILPLAQTLMDNNFELVPVLKQLFKSEHFFDEHALGVVVKSPYDIIFHFVNETNFFYDDEIMNAFIYLSGLLGQEMYDPLDVSGWQRDEEWINTSTLTGRWQFFELYVDFLLTNGFEESLRDLAKDLSNDSNDPYFITMVIIDRLISKELHTPADYDTATDIFKWEIPQNYYDEGLWNLDWPEAPLQVSLLLKHLATIPEFQLK